MSGRTVVRLLSLFLLLLLACLFLLYYVAATPSGTRLLLAGIDRVTPGDLTVGSVGGSLARGLRLGDLRYRTDHYDVSVSRTDLTWKYGSLLTGTVHLERFRIQSVRVEYGPVAPADRDSPDLDPGWGWFPVPPRFRVDELEIVDGVFVRTGAETTSLRLNRGMFSGSYTAPRLRIDKMSVRTPAAELDGSGWVESFAPYPLDIRASWTYQPAEPGTVFQGEGTLSGNLEEVQLRQELRRPVEAEWTAKLRQPFTDPGWEARIEFAGLNPAALNPALPESSLTGDLTARGDRTSATLEGRVHPGVPALGPLRVQCEVGVTDREWEVRRAEVHLERTDGRVVAEGRWEPRANRGELNLRWRDLSWPVREDPRLTSPEGRLSLDGNPKKASFRLDGSFAGPDLPDAQIEARGQGTPGGVRVRSFTARLLGGRLEGRGRLGWDPSLRWQLTAAGDSIDPGRRWEHWTGALSFRVASEGERDEEGLRGRFDLKQLEGRLRDQPITGAGSGSFRPGSLRIAELRLRAGAASLRLDGRIDDRLDLDWRLEVPDLRPWHPDLGGQLRGSGDLRGPREAPVVSARLGVDSLRWGPYGIDRVESDLRIDFAFQRPSNLSVQARAVRLPAGSIEEVFLRGDGSLNEHELEIVLRSGPRSARLEARGGLKGRRWVGALRRLTLRPSESTAWELEQKADVVAGLDEGYLSETCLSSGSGRLCGSLERSQTQWQGDLRLSRVAVSLFNPWLPVDAGAEGTLEGSVQWTYGPRQGLVGEANFEVEEGSLSYERIKREPVVFRFENARLQGSMTPGELLLDTSLEWAKGGVLETRLRVEDPLSGAPIEQRAFNAELTARVPSVSFAEDAVENLRWSRAEATASLSAGGTFGRPAVRGEVNLRGRGVEFPALGVTAGEVEIEARSSGDDRLELRARAQSDEGGLTADGVLRWRSADDWSAEFDLDGEGFEAVNLTELRAVVSPRLDLRVDPPNLSLRGRVRVPEARVTPGGTPGPQVVKASPDVTVVDGVKPARGRSVLPRWNLDGEVQVTLGKGVQVQADEFEGTVTGDLTLMPRLNQPPLARGSLTVQGTYSAYGQQLQVRDGQLLYDNDPLENPRLNLEARRQLKDVVVGVRVRGRLNQPKLTLFSEPPMDHVDILSYLILGRPAARVSGGSADVLMKAASTAGLVGGDALLESLGREFGLDVSIEAGKEFEESAIVVGRYLSPELYVRYVIDLFKTGEVVQLIYELNERWSVQVEGGDRTGADLIFQIER